MQTALLSDISSIFSNNEMKSITELKEAEYFNIPHFIEELCRSMEIITGVKFVDLELRDEFDVTRRKRKINLAENRVYEAKLNFTFQKDEEAEIENHNFRIMFPKLIDGNYFEINGTRYSSMFQFNNYKPIHNVNASGNKTVLIKTLINSFSLELKSKSKRISQSTITVFTKKINLALVLLALNEFDLDKTLAAVFKPDSWSVSDMDIENFDRTTMITLGEQMITFKESVDVDEFYAVITSFNTLKLQTNKLLDENYLIKKLGSYFTTNTNSYLDKGSIVSKIMIRVLDPETAKLLNVSNLTELLVKEIIFSYYDIRVNPNDIVERKLKFSESLLFPLYKRISDNVYIYLNSRRKNINNVFKIPPEIILQYATTSEVLQYDDKPSMFDAINRYKVSLAPIGSGKQVSEKLRNIEESYVGFLDLFSSPSGKSTGLSTYLNTLANEYIITDDGTITTEEALL